MLLFVGVWCTFFFLFFDKYYSSGIALAQEQAYANNPPNYQNSDRTEAPNVAYANAQNPQQHTVESGYVNPYPSSQPAARNVGVDEAKNNVYAQKQQQYYDQQNQQIPVYNSNNVATNNNNIPSYTTNRPAGGNPDPYAANRKKQQNINTYFKEATKLEKIEMPRHSFESPLTYDNNLNEWDLGMASVSAKQHFVLLPGVTNRTAQFWNKSPVNTNNFEVTFTFEVKGVDTARPQGFAFWYVHEEYAKIVPTTVEGKEQWNFFGYKGNFSGLGVFFSVLDKTNTYVKPSISAIYNPPGSNIFYKTTNIPSRDGIYYKYRNMNLDSTISIPHVFKLTVTKRSIIGQVRAYTSNQYFPCFHLKDLDIKPGGFVGFTGYNGREMMLKKGVEGGVDLASKVSDMVILRSFKMYNLDLNTEGENVNKNTNMHSNVLEDAEMSKLLNTNLSDGTEQTEAIKQVSRLLYKLIAEQTPREQSILRTLNSLTASVNKLALDLKEVKSELQLVYGFNQTDIMNSMKSELNGLKTLFHRHSQHHASTLHSLTSSIDSKLKSANSNSGGRELRELAERAASLEEVIKHRGFASSYLTFAVIVVLIFFAIFVWKRFRDMEKKHYL